MRHLQSIASATLLLLWAASNAHAQGEVTSLRMAKQPDFDRIVFDLSDYVDAEQSSTEDEFALELAAPKPDLPLADEDRLADLRVYFEESAGGSRVVVDRQGRNIRVFRLSNPDRLVLDLGRRGGAPLRIPGDAGTIPEKAPEPLPAPRREARPTPPPAPQDDQEDLSALMNKQPVETAPRTPPEEAKPAPQRDLSEASVPPPNEPVWVLVRAIEIEGVEGSPSLDELRDLKLAVSEVRGGYVAPRQDAAVTRIPLRALTGDDRNGRRLSGSVLQLIVETIAAAYARNQKLGTKVDIRKADLERLLAPDSDGKLVIRVREASEAQSASR